MHAHFFEDSGKDNKTVSTQNNQANPIDLSAFTTEEALKMIEGIGLKTYVKGTLPDIFPKKTLKKATKACWVPYKKLARFKKYIKLRQHLT